MRYLKDLLFTDRYLIKGHVPTGRQRLSTFLNSNRKRFLEAEEAFLIQHDAGDRIQTGLAMVRINDILFAYEMEESGDEGLRTLGGQDKAAVAVHLHLESEIRISLTGLVRKRALNSDAVRRNDFMVLVNPRFQEILPQAGPEYALLQSAPYLIVNRDRISILLL